MFFIFNAIVVKMFLNYDKIIFELQNSSSIYHRLILNNFPSKPFLSQYSRWFKWYHVDTFGHVYYYFNHLIFLFFLIILFLVFSNKIDNYLKKFIIWKNIKENKKPRIIIFYTVLFLFFTLLTKANTVVFFGGISGWDHSKNISIISENSNSLELKLIKNDFYYKAINRYNIQFIHKNGYLDDLVMFLHYKTGQVLPFNLGLLNMVFPSLQYPILFENNTIDNETQCRLINHLKISLDKSAQKELSFFNKIRYPNHTPYQYIDYSNYPSSDLLKKFSVHRVYLKLKNEKVEILGGKLKQSIQCQNITE